MLAESITTATRAGHGAPADPYKRLACALLLRAARDAQRGDVDAAEWLDSEGRRWAELAGLELRAAAAIVGQQLARARLPAQV